MKDAVVAYFQIKMMKQPPENFAAICKAIGDSPFPACESRSELYEVAKELAGRFAVEIPADGKAQMIEAIEDPQPLVKA